MISRAENHFMGIEIGGTKLQMITGTESGFILERLRYSIDVNTGAAGILEQIKEGIEKLMNSRIRGIGVGFGGPVEWKTGIIQLSHQVPGWENFNLKDWLQKLTRLPVFIDNDANTAALAEATLGKAQGYPVLFYMTIGSGIGGGLIVNETIYHGRKPGEVEIGHIRLDKNGTTLESQCSGWAVNRKVKAYTEADPGCLLARLTEKNSGPEARFLKPALEANDAGALTIMESIAEDISFALSHIVHLFNPDVIVIGGGLSLLDEHLRFPVANKLPGFVMQAMHPVPPVIIAGLAEDVVPLGALQLAKAALATKNKIPTI